MATKLNLDAGILNIIKEFETSYRCGTVCLKEY